MILVVDTDVARAAGDTEGRSICCTEILKAINEAKLHIHFGRLIDDEWLKHRSSFTVGWYAEMLRRGRVDLTQAEECQALGEHLRTLHSSHNHSSIMWKDRHLVDAALARNFRIVSGDKLARKAFRKTALPAVPILGSLYWAQADEGDAGAYAIQWLRNGAPDDETLMLHCEIN